VEALKLLDIRADEISDVILTHLHYDHVGNFDRFHRARFHLQERELAYATGKYMRHPFLSHSFEVDDVVGVVRLNYGGRVVFHDGDAELAPGVSLHLATGHSAGLQFVSVQTQRGRLVLASDVTHYYENMDSGRPYTTTFHVGETLESYHKVRAIAASSDHIVPGHDPLVMQLYPPARPDLDGIAVRLDLPPNRSRAAR
jgi:glyoxylase-like metal-dependent hydrolase (beta-lactamase superfamily II)